MSGIARICSALLAVGILATGIAAASKPRLSVQSRRALGERPAEARTIATAAAACTCYACGQNWSPGATACMGGFRTLCTDRGGEGTNCGWDNVKQDGNDVRCDGTEKCTPKE